MGLNKKIRGQIKKMPKYKIQPEVYENLALATSRAFGRPQEIEIAEENLEESQAAALGQAKDVTSSTSALLSTLAAIEGGKQKSVRGLAQDEASIRSANVKDLYGAKSALAEEKDKAWYQNVYAPWEAKLRSLQQQKANRNAFWSNLAGGLLGGAGKLLSGGLLGGGNQQQSGATNIDATYTPQGIIS